MRFTRHERLLRAISEESGNHVGVARRAAQISHFCCFLQYQDGAASAQSRACAR